jgi:Crinkler effector protein N-terminal domain
MPTLWCIVIGETTQFPVTINETQYVGELKEAIKKKKEHTLGAFDADALNLYKVNIKVPDDDDDDEKLIKAVEDAWADRKEATRPAKLKPARMLSMYSWESDHTKETIHIIIQPPGGESIDSSLW